MSNDSTSVETGFDPAKHLRKVGAADYLPVAARLMWFRDAYPAGTIETEAVELTDQRAIFRAVVRKVTGDGVVAGSATGYGSETPGDFRDYIEKAESKAIGRALGALGYGTAAAVDDEGDRIVDAPVERPTRAQAPQRPQPTNLRSMPDRSGTPPLPPEQQSSSQAFGFGGGGRPMTDKQANFIRRLAKDRGWTIQAPDGSTHHDEDAIDRDCQQRFGKRFADLTTRDASTLIDKWQDEPLPDDLELIAQQTDAALASRPGQPGNDRYTNG